jgi:hypothetical protein
VNEQSEVERLRAARYEARELGYLLMVDDADNIEPLRYQAWAAPAVSGQVTMAASSPTVNRSGKLRNPV